VCYNERMSKEELFWQKINKNDPNGCWIWTAGTFPSGYGKFEGTQRKQWQAHRFSWTIVNGPIPEGVSICHHCDIPKCVNPDHLFLGSVKDNMQDAARKGRMSRGEDHPNVTLTEVEVAEIFLSTKTSRELANIYLVGRRTIRDIKDGYTWTWITDYL